MSPNNIPYVLSGQTQDWSWLDNFSWPVNPQEMLRVNGRVMSRFNLFVGELNEDDRRVVLLARGIDDAATMIEASLVATSSTSVQPDNPVLNWMRTRDVDGKDIKICLKRMGDRFRLQKIPLAKFRQIARTYSWSGFSGLVSSIFVPQILAITHNPLLVAEAKRQGVRMSFKHAELVFEKYMAKAISESNAINRDWLKSLSKKLVAVLVADEMLDLPSREILEKLLVPHCYQLLSDAAKALDALRMAKNLPHTLWTGNGSYYSSRAIGLEIIRRGGVVRRFDHGGTASLLDSQDYLVEQELAVSSEFVVPTNLAASLPTINDAVRALPKGQSVRIFAGQGDPALKPAMSSFGKVRSGRLKVMFVGTAYYGFYQSFPAFPAAPVYLDWQRRILDLLETFDIDLVHKPHPGGVFMGCPPPLRSVGRLETRSFEDAIKEIDLLIFDYAGSTTFSVALSSDKPMILLDFGSLSFQPEVKKEICKRCTIVNVGVDHRNRLIVDSEVLRQTVCGLHQKPDPSYFRELFLGE